MSTKKITRAEIRNLLHVGAAKELTMQSGISPYDVETIALSSGIAGITAGLFRHKSSGELYVIPDRSPALLYYAHH